MANNYDDYGYEEDNNENNTNIFKKLLIVVLIIIAILLVLWLLKSCNGKTNNEEGENKFNYEDTLITAGKHYFENNGDELPTNVGECIEVKLEKLVDAGLVESDKFTNCNNDTTYVRVCKLSNGNLQYTPWLACTDKISDDEYDNGKEGTLSDVVEDESYITFKFLGQVVNSSGNLGQVETLLKNNIPYSSYKTLSTYNEYRYRDTLYTWKVTSKKYYSKFGEKASAKDVNEYYISEPNSQYGRYDNKVTNAYKWYTVTGEKVYYKGSNGAKGFSEKNTAPAGYPNRDDNSCISVTVYHTRTVTGDFAPKLYYVCAANEKSTIVKYSLTPCGQEGTASENLPYKKKTVYSCVNDSSTSVVDNIVNSADYRCKSYSGYTSYKTGTCDGKDKDLCEQKTTAFCNWYKIDEKAPGAIKKYYPSGAATADKENTYYTSAPISGAQKDVSSGPTTAYKWYKATTFTTTDYTAVAPKGYDEAVKTSSTKLGNWSAWSTSNPKTNDGRIREIETRTWVKLQQILDSADEWNNIDDEYLTEEELIKVLQNKGYDVKSLEDINNNGQLRYQVKMVIRNKKESAN